MRCWSSIMAPGMMRQISANIENARKDKEMTKPCGHDLTCNLPNQAPFT